MYFAVVKLTFEAAARLDAEADRRELRALAEKLRARFKVCAAVCESPGDVPALAVTALGSSAEKLSQSLDALSEFCETSYGRIESEEALLDHVDNVGDYEDE
jgi:hypothetical protein